FAGRVGEARDGVPGKVGVRAGGLLGLGFGWGGVGAAGRGKRADATSIGYVYQVGAYLPRLGVVAVLLPDVARKRA
ncbi:MFS transporter, partial [Achromobacter ruhlandii]|nr:MFS transporter [Achromobacter ruhlandii]